MLTISENEPTPILKDFAAFIHYLKTHKIVLTKVNEFISGKNLFEPDLPKIIGHNQIY